MFVHKMEVTISSSKNKTDFSEVRRNLNFPLLLEIEEQLTSDVSGPVT
jgi:hypothetical protein